MKRLAGFLIFSLLFSPAMAEEKTIIAAFGDSLIAGNGLATGDTFPVQFEQRLFANGYPSRVINDGISGNTTADGLARINSILLQHPDIVIVELGGNDLLKQVPPAEVKKNLEAILRTFKQAKIRIFLAGQKTPPGTEEKYAEEFNAIFPDLAKEYDATYYPDFLGKASGIMGLMQEDGVHPTRDGMAVVVDGIAPIIELDIFKHR